MPDPIRQSERWLRPLASSGSGGGAGAVYNSGATTISSGATVSLAVDESGNLKVVEQYAPGAEDNLAGVLKVEQRYSHSLITSATTVAVLTAAGFVHSFNVGMPSCPTISFYDSPLPGSNLIQRLHAGYPVGTHLLNVSVLNGFTVDATSGGVAPSIMVAKRS